MCPGGGGSHLDAKQQGGAAARRHHDDVRALAHQKDNPGAGDGRGARLPGERRLRQQRALEAPSLLLQQSESAAAAAGARGRRPQRSQGQCHRPCRASRPCHEEQTQPATQVQGGPPRPEGCSSKG